MDEIRYLKELQRQGRLPELLEKLELPSKEAKSLNYECRIYFFSDRLTINTWENFPAHGANRISSYELNDYMLLTGIKDPQQKKLQTFYDFMKKHFVTYKFDCISFLKDQKEKRLTEIEEKCAKAKEIIITDIDDKMDCVLGEKK